MKSERQAAEERLAAVQQQLAEARDEAQRLQDLHGHAEDSARLVRDRDRKVGDGEVGEGWQGGVQQWRDPWGDPWGDGAERPLVPHNCALRRSLSSPRRSSG